MNKTKIEWADYTWNPITGCKHGCQYCYARKIAERFRGSAAWPNGFDPTTHYNRFHEPQHILQQSSIFVGSMTDIFGAWQNPEDIAVIFDEMAACSQPNWHTFILLTKAPENINRFLYEAPLFYFGGGDYLPNVWIGVTVENKGATWRIDVLRKSAEYFHKFVSFEPLLGEIPDLDLTGIDAVIIGAQTNPSVVVTPEMIQPIGKAAFEAGNIPMFCKDSLPDWCHRRELPWKLNKPLERGLHKGGRRS